MFLSKVIDQGDITPFAKHGIDRSHFATEGEQQAYDFVTRYAAENGGKAPSYATLTAECPDVTYIPEVTDSYEFLARKLRDSAGKRRLVELFNGRIDPKSGKTVPSDIMARFGELDSEEFISELTSKLETIRIETRTNVPTIGRTLEDISSDFLAEYERREAGRSFKLWRTPFSQLNDKIGGFFSGDVYGVIAESGRGKTYLTVSIVDSLLRQGANVLVKSFEVKEYSWIARLISVATAVDGLFRDENTGTTMGIPNKAMLSGKLEDYVRDNFVSVVSGLNSYYPGKLYFQGKSGKELTRTLDDLERELRTAPIDAVVVDPFYGFSDVYGRNVNRTAGGAAEMAATRFEQIIGDNDVVGIYTVQATIEKKSVDDADRREIRLPTRDQVKTSKRLLDIATILFSFDSVESEGIAALGIEKGRNGGEDFRLDLLALLDHGVLREFPQGAEVASQFVDTF